MKNCSELRFFSLSPGWHVKNHLYLLGDQRRQHLLPFWKWFCNDSHSIASPDMSRQTISEYEIQYVILFAFAFHVKRTNLSRILRRIVRGSRTVSSAYVFTQDSLRPIIFVNYYLPMQSKNRLRQQTPILLPLCWFWSENLNCLRGIVHGIY